MPRDGTKNLVSITDRPLEERREICRLGGIASQKKQRERKTLKENMNMLLSLPVVGEKDRTKLRKSGIDPDSIDNSMLIIIGLFAKAKRGDVGAFKELRDLIGESGQTAESATLIRAMEILMGVKSEV